MSAPTATMSSALPSYEIGGELGRGGFGVVHAGRHVRLGRKVAIKTLVPHLAEFDDIRRRFGVEAKVLASLDHPHVVPVYDYVEADGLCLLVMESLPGGTAWDLFRTTGISSTTACAIAMVTCAAVHHAHQHGVLHRDIKPENLMFAADGQMKVTDFGIARVVGGGDVLATSNGDILGTPAYMAPEQAGGEELGPPADVYATGVMLYEMLSGTLPFSSAGGGLAVVVRHMNEDPVPLRSVAPDVPRPLADVVMRAIARRVEHRYATAEDFGVALGAAVAAVEGTGWLARSDVKLVSGGPIASSSELLVAPQRTPARAFGSGYSGSSGYLGTSGYPGSSGAQAPLTPPPAPLTGSPAAFTPPGLPQLPRTGQGVPFDRVVRPSEVLRPGAVPFARSGSDELVPVRRVLDVPEVPRGRMLVAGGLALVAVAAAFLSPLGGGSDGDLPARSVLVAGQDVTDGAVDLDLADPTAVTLTGAAPAAARSVALSVDVAGIGMVHTAAEPLTPTAGGRSATVDATGVDLLLAGPASGQLRLLDEQGTEVGRQGFTVEPARSFASLPGALLLVAVLALLAYGESLARPLWRNGKATVLARAGLVVLAGVGGALLVPLAWVTGPAEPHLVTLLLCGVLGGVAGWLGLAKLEASGKRRRMKRLLENAAVRAAAADRF